MIKKIIKFFINIKKFFYKKKKNQKRDIGIPPEDNYPLY